MSTIRPGAAAALKGAAVKYRLFVVRLHSVVLKETKRLAVSARTPGLAREIALRESLDPDHLGGWEAPVWSEARERASR